MKTWKPVAAGVLSILSGAFIVWYRASELIRIGSSPVGIGIGLLAIAGGILAIRRKAWGWALAGAICAVVPPHPWGNLLWTPVLGIAAVVLVALSKSEFALSETPEAARSQASDSGPGDGFGHTR